MHETEKKRNIEYLSCVKIRFNFTKTDLIKQINLRSIKNKKSNHPGNCIDCERPVQLYKEECISIVDSLLTLSLLFYIFTLHLLF